MDLGIKGKRALVMGASSGIGKATAKHLIMEGAKVAICARGVDRLNATAEEIGASPYPCDLSVPGEAEKLAKNVIADFGGIDILVVNTGGPPPTTFDTSTNEQWREGFESLMMSSIDVMRACAPEMKKNKWGRIVAITSLSVREPVDSLIISNSIRAAVHGMLNSLSREYGPHGITVNTMMTGLTLTERLTKSLKSGGFDQKSFEERIPLGRLATPDDPAMLITFLASEAASYITGQAIAVDGGLMKFM